jgi:Lysyl oxidase/S-layer homology domain
MLGTIGLLFAIIPATPVLAASDRLPDLKVATTKDFRIERTSSGRRLLRFSGMMLNVGKGPFEVRGARASTSSPWKVDQIVYRTGGATRRIHTTAQMNWAGDGHNHWHVLRMLTYHMWSTTSSTLRTAKIGFCFFDTNRRTTKLPGAPASHHYLRTGCGTRNVLHTKVGISVGWADLYPAAYAYQWIDITGLPAGTYTVRGAVDLYNKFAEVSETNNCTWSKISFAATGTKVKLLDVGNSCSNDHKNSPFAADINWAVAGGIATNCDADMFCTTDLVSRADVASYVAKAMKLPAATRDFFTDDNGSTHEADINRVAEAGVMAGCSMTTFCPAGTVSRGAIATILATALNLPPTATDHFTDDNSSPDEAAINEVAEAGIMAGCTATTFCPTTKIKRGETMAFLHRAFGTAPAAVAPGAGSLASADEPGLLAGLGGGTADVQNGAMLTSADTDASANDQVAEDPADWVADPDPSDATQDAIGPLMDGSLGPQFACVIGS